MVQENDFSSGFSGRKKFELKNSKFQFTRNKESTVNNTHYSGHALDQMQNRGIPPSIVEHAIKTGEKYLGNKNNTIIYYDKINKVRVIVNQQTGKVITVIWGDGK